MKETLELRINLDYAHLLFGPDEGLKLGLTVKAVEISKDDKRYYQIPEIEKFVEEKYGKRFFFGWRIWREYSKGELNKAQIFNLLIKSTFEPTGQECGTQYDEEAACDICGANRRQIGPLILKKGSIPKKDIARTIAGEVVVSAAFVEAFEHWRLKGADFKPVLFRKDSSSYYQMIPTTELEISGRTVAGVNPFDLSTESSGAIEIEMPSGKDVKLPKEYYKCPRGHTIGLNLLSEAFVINSPFIQENDLLVSRQKIGVKRGLLRPEPIYLVSQGFRSMIEEKKLKGFDFEVAHIGEI